MSRFVLSLLLLSLLFSPSARAEEKTSLNLDPATIRVKLVDLFRKSQTNAMLATVRSGEREVVSLAQGESMTGVPARLDQRVRIGGVAQSYLGVLLMKLVERGDLALDDKVSKWLPELSHSNEITVEMLILSTSGYKDYVPDPKFVSTLESHPFADLTRDDLLAFVLKDGELDFPPGTKSKYAHTNLVVLGKLLEKATGKGMDRLHRELLLEPLGMKNTGYSLTAELPEPVIHAFGTDRGVYEEVTYWSPSWAADSGPLYAPIDEVARWARVHGRGELLTPQSQARLIARPATAAPEGPYYAWGFVVANGWYFFNPSFNGYSGTCAYNPSLDLTVVVYTTDTPDSAKTHNPAYQAVLELTGLIAPQQPLRL